MSASAKAKKIGKRYTSDEKTEIVSFVETFNSDNGRGGQSAAAKKFGISQLTLASWLKAAGNSAPAGKRSGRKPGPKNMKSTTSSSGEYSAKLQSLNALASQIDKLESELSKLKAKFRKSVAAL